MYTIFFMILYMYIAAGQGLTTPWGRNFDVNRNILSLRSFVASFKKISLKSDFIQFFNDYIYVYNLRAGADSPQETKFLCPQKSLITLPICCKFQRNLSEAGGIKPPGDKVLMSTETSCHWSSVASFQSLTTIISEKSIVLHFPIQKHQGPNLTLP